MARASSACAAARGEARGRVTRSPSALPPAAAGPPPPPAAGETPAAPARGASRSALRAAGIAAGDLDLIVMATTTPDMVFPSSACFLQAKLGARNCPAFDVQAVCSGFVYGLSTADPFMRTGQYRNALVVGAGIYSRILDWSDRSTCVLFGDGAGSVVLRRDRTPGILSSQLHADGSYANQLSV